jgi:hypothetical protein
LAQRLSGRCDPAGRLLCHSLLPCCALSAVLCHHVVPCCALVVGPMTGRSCVLRALCCATGAVCVHVSEPLRPAVRSRRVDGSRPQQAWRLQRRRRRRQQQQQQQQQRQQRRSASAGRGGSELSRSSSARCVRVWFGRRLRHHRAQQGVVRSLWRSLLSDQIRSLDSWSVCRFHSIWFVVSQQGSHLRL